MQQVNSSPQLTDVLTYSDMIVTGVSTISVTKINVVQDSRFCVLTDLYDLGPEQLRHQTI